jgi:hypothetical protein
MLLTSRIERTPAPLLPRTSTSAFQVLLYRQLPFAFPTQHCHFIPFTLWPNARLVIFERIVAAYARVEFLAAEVFDGDDVEGGFPVRTLRCWCNFDAIDRWYITASQGVGHFCCVGDE